jgi:hypothetical protein
VDRAKNFMENSSREREIFYVPVRAATMDRFAQIHHPKKLTSFGIPLAVTKAEDFVKRSQIFEARMVYDNERESQ